MSIEIIEARASARIAACGDAVQKMTKDTIEARAAKRIEAASGQVWFDSLSKNKQQEYLKKHPKSKYRLGQSNKSTKTPEQKRKAIKDTQGEAPRALKKPDPTGLKDPKKSPSYMKALKEYEDQQKSKKSDKPEFGKNWSAHKAITDPKHHTKEGHKHNEKAEALHNIIDKDLRSKGIKQDGNVGKPNAQTKEYNKAYEEHGLHKVMKKHEGWAQKHHNLSAQLQKPAKKKGPVDRMGGPKWDKPQPMKGNPLPKHKRKGPVGRMGGNKWDKMPPSKSSQLKPRK